MHYLYCLTNLTNGKFYIGETADYAGRLAVHKYQAKQVDTCIGLAIKEHGWDSFHKEILYIGDRLEVKRMEEILHMQSGCTNTDVGYNVKIGQTLSASSKLKLSLARSGKRNPKYNPFVINGVRYENQREAAEHLQMRRTTISARLHDPAYTTYYFIKENS